MDPFLLEPKSLTWPVDWPALFGREAPLLVEIGFGGGHFLVDLARRRPEANIIGVEISLPAIRRAQRKLQQAAAAHVRLLPVDARELLWTFPVNHWEFLARNLAIGALVSMAVLRYFYVTHQWVTNMQREAQSRVTALQARIRPHFLFNSMNTIAALTRTNPGAAEQAVEDLADLFRASLSNPGESITLTLWIAVFLDPPPQFFAGPFFA